MQASIIIAVEKVIVKDVYTMPSASAQKQPPEHLSPLPARGTVLIVEDDVFLQKLLVDKFKKEGYEVEGAEDGEHALQALAKNIPMIVLLDLLMPGMDGFQVLEHIRKEERTKTLPVIVLSNLGEQEHINRAKALGADDYLIKAHLFLDEIVQRVEEIIKKRYL